MLHLQVRRLFCDRADCERRTFAEQCPRTSWHAEVRTTSRPEVGWGDHATVAPPSMAVSRF
ncbi:hypothetical protein AB0G85_36535, partial [Streptomyces sioyaensis]|uniref:hypothetical protein n=1 Tax=Streptomyces sioyaensis TaxID=67364 RepID=UPI0033ECA0C7